MRWLGGLASLTAAAGKAAGSPGQSARERRTQLRLGERPRRASFAASPGRRESDPLPRRQASEAPAGR
ncbi:MAG TPA: hypothetical protein VH520_13055, partial [Streptosporangiaceae bacterium]